MFCFSCSSTKTESTTDEKYDVNPEEKAAKENKSLFIENAEPFYPIKETVEEKLSLPKL